jgi:sporulation protein YlmC with PRC-barrel domain
MLVKKLTGKEVIGARGEKIGKVTDFDIDILSGKVKSVLISAGFNKTYKIKMDDIITVGDAIIIRLSESDLKQAAARKGK